MCWSGGTDTSAAYRYDPAANQWTALADLPQARSGASAVTDGTSIYILGGNISGNATNTLWRYNPATNTYTTLAGMPHQARSPAAAALLNGKIYVINGFNGTNTVDVYNIATDTWEASLAYPQGYANITAVALGGYIYVAGGAQPTCPRPAGKRTATVTRTPANTPTLTPCSVCNLYIPDVTLTCNLDGTVHWTATVRNNGACTVGTPWEVRLQVQRNWRNFKDTVTATGTGSFPPGDTTVSGDLCEIFPANTTGVRAAFALTSDQRRCNPTHLSAAIAPCPVTPVCPAAPAPAAPDSPGE